MNSDILTNDYLECLYAVLEAQYPSTVARLRRHTTACAERVERLQTALVQVSLEAEDHDSRCPVGGASGISLIADDALEATP